MGNLFELPARGDQKVSPTTPYMRNRISWVYSLYTDGHRPRLTLVLVLSKYSNHNREDSDEDDNGDMNEISNQADRHLGITLEVTWIYYGYLRLGM